MKKILAAILLLVYFTVSTGAPVNIHYCMGNVKSIDFSTSKGSRCERCGMKSRKGCCHDDLKIIKLSVDQQLAKLNSWFFDCVPENAPHYNSLALTIQAGEKISKTYYYSPPDKRSCGIYLFDRVLRI
jgi:hypothetical protein